MTSYSHAATGNDQVRTIQASGAGSRIELPGVVTITGGTSYDSHIAVQALAGGLVTLPVVRSVSEARDAETSYRKMTFNVNT